MDDAELSSRYAEDHSEDAFATLVQRHLDRAYSVPGVRSAAIGISPRTSSRRCFPRSPARPPSSRNGPCSAAGFTGRRSSPPSTSCALNAAAARAAMSERNFQRVFTREPGKSPAHYVEEIRIEAVRRKLERSTQGLEEIAAACGFGSADVMGRSFFRQLKVTPAEYRARFRSSGICGNPAAPRGSIRPRRRSAQHLIECPDRL